MIEIPRIKTEGYEHENCSNSDRDKSWFCDFSFDISCNFCARDTSLLSFPYSIIRTDGLSLFEDANRELFSLSFVGVSVRGSRMSREASGA